MPKQQPQPRTLTLAGQPVPVVRIGRGQFSTAYRAVERPAIVYLVTDQRDRAKEMLWRFTQDAPGWRTRSPHIPRLEPVEHALGEAFRVWETDWSDRLDRRAHPEAARIQQRLRAHNQTAQMAVVAHYGLRYREYDHKTDTLALVVEAAQHDPAIPATVADALEQLAAAGEHMGGDTFFDFHNRNNLGVRDGVLVLRDCLASARLLDITNEERRRRMP